MSLQTLGAIEQPALANLLLCLCLITRWRPLPTAFHLDKTRTRQEDYIIPASLAE